MNFSKSTYQVINHYLISNLEHAYEFDFIGYLHACLNYAESISQDSSCDVQVNYGSKSFKSRSGFNTFLSKSKNTEITNVIATNKGGSIYLMVDNPLISYISPPKYGSIHMQHAISESIHNYDSLIKFILDTYPIFPFDYGYIVELDKGFDFITERKVKSGLFKTESLFHGIDKIWIDHCLGIKYGYLKKLYKANFINQSHLLNKPIHQCYLDKIGSFAKINDEITLWTLTDREVSLANSILRESDSMIADESTYKAFLDSPEARTLNANSSKAS